MGFYQHSPFFPFTITTIITTYRPRTLNCYISFFLPNDANLDKVTKILVTLTEPIERMMQSAGGRQVSFAPFAVYIITSFLKKNQPTLRIQIKLTPKKAKKKNYGILDFYKFLSAKS